MVVVDGKGVPIGVQLASAQIAECRLAEGTLQQVKVPRVGRGRPRSHLRRVIADRGYDSDALRTRFKQRGTELIVPYRKNVRNRRFEDKRKLRRYRKRWKIERTNAWLQNGVPGEFCTRRGARNWYERSLEWHAERRIRQSRS